MQLLDVMFFGRYLYLVSLRKLGVGNEIYLTNTVIILIDRKETVETCHLTG